MVRGPKWCGKTTTCVRHAKSILYMADPDTHDQNLRMACTVIVIVPILLAYPFFQRYFVQGLTVGSVKG